MADLHGIGHALTYEQLDRLGRLADKASNYIAASRIPMLPLAIHIEGMVAGMEEIRDEAQALYRELGGEE